MTTFTHDPRPAQVSQNEYSDQRRYGASPSDAMMGVRDATRCNRIELLRFAGDPRVKLSIHMLGIGQVGVYLDAEALRELARNLIDAAEDLRDWADAVAIQEAT